MWSSLNRRVISQWHCELYARVAPKGGFWRQKDKTSISGEAGTGKMSLSLVFNDLIVEPSVLAGFVCAPQEGKGVGPITSFSSSTWASLREYEWGKLWLPDFTTTVIYSKWDINYKKIADIEAFIFQGLRRRRFSRKGSKHGRHLWFSR